mmetsp:Transcript_5806/g.10337  ORF Transcript_5806/g.10337 Transcript_5806/m.10337 type:complete len:153 (+) Transcript_5806:41-499(+)
MNSKVSLFTNMFSLLNPALEATTWLLSLELPKLSFDLPKPEVFDCEASTEATCESDPMQQDELSKDSRKKKTNTVCQHFDRKHYAKNMCNNCYHRYGRYQFAYSCPHKDRKLYAKGKCQFCYLSNYHRSQVFGRRRRKRKIIVEAAEVPISP